MSQYLVYSGSDLQSPSEPAVQVEFDMSLQDSDSRLKKINKKVKTLYKNDRGARRPFLVDRYRLRNLKCKMTTIRIIAETFRF